MSCSHQVSQHYDCLLFLSFLKRKKSFLRPKFSDIYIEVFSSQPIRTNSSGSAFIGFFGYIRLGQLTEILMKNESHVQSDGGGHVRGASIRLHRGTAAFRREALAL